MSVKDNVRSLFEIIDALRNIDAATSPRSLLDATKAARIEPICRISRDCMSLEYIYDLVQSLNSLYASLFFQAISLNTTINGVRVVRILDQFNPDRSFSAPSFESFDNTSLRLENYEYRLPLTMESNGIDYASKQLKEIEKKAKEYGLTGANNGSTSVNANNKDLLTLSENSDLSVGKLLNVDICVGNRDFTVPVNIKLDLKSMTTDNIVSLLGNNKDSKSFTERYYDVVSGKRSVMDLIFATDLLREHKKMLLTDKDGTYTEILRRVNNSKKYSLLSMNFSLADASNIFIISEDVAKQIEYKLGGKLSSPVVREKMFANVYAMIVVVVHPLYEQLTFYYNGIARSTEMSVKAIKRSGKNKGPDIADVMKAFQLGNAPTF